VDSKRTLLRPQNQISGGLAPRCMDLGPTFGRQSRVHISCILGQLRSTKSRSFLGQFI
jgi:hypothetical protein